MRQYYQVCFRLGAMISRPAIHRHKDKVNAIADMRRNGGVAVEKVTVELVEHEES